MSEENHEHPILYKALEKILFNEKDFEDLKVIISRLGNGNSYIKQLKQKIITSRIRILKDISNFIMFHLREQRKPSEGNNSSQFEREIQEKNEFLTLLSEKIENIYQNLSFDRPLSGKKIISITKETAKDNNNEPTFYAIDGTNVALEEKTSEGKPKLLNIISMIEKLGMLRITNYEILCDANTRYHIDEKSKYETLVEKGIIRQTPAGEKADLYVLILAKDNNGYMISNDLFKEYMERYGIEWIKERRIPFTVVRNVFYSDKLEKIFAKINAKAVV